MKLECENHTAGEKVDWLKEGVPVSEKFAEKEDWVKVTDGVLTFFKSDKELHGNYSCNTTANASSTSFFRVVRKLLFIYFCYFKKR